MVGRKIMKIEIDIPESVITDAAIRAWKSSFRSPEYSHREGGEGYEAIRAEVQKHLLTLATSEEIRAAVKSAAAQLAPHIIRESVTEELKKQVKRIVKEEKDGNTLFSSNAKLTDAGPRTPGLA
jgi:hypothetical protein